MEHTEETVEAEYLAGRFSYEDAVQVLIGMGRSEWGAERRVDIWAMSNTSSQNRKDTP